MNTASGPSVRLRVARRFCKVAFFILFMLHFKILGPKVLVHWIEPNARFGHGVYECISFHFQLYFRPKEPNDVDYFTIHLNDQKSLSTLGFIWKTNAWSLLVVLSEFWKICNLHHSCIHFLFVLLMQLVPQKVPHLPQLKSKNQHLKKKILTERSWPNWKLHFFGILAHCETSSYFLLFSIT